MRISNEGQARARNSSTIHEAWRDIHGNKLCANLRHENKLVSEIHALRVPKKSCPVGTHVSYLRYFVTSRQDGVSIDFLNAHVFAQSHFTADSAWHYACFACECAQCEFFSLR